VGVGSGSGADLRVGLEWPVVKVLMKWWICWADVFGVMDSKKFILNFYFLYAPNGSPTIRRLGTVFTPVNSLSLA